MNASQLANVVYAIAPMYAPDVLSEVISPSPLRDRNIVWLANAVREAAKNPAVIFTADETRDIHAAARALA